jgi:hypothetical protein
MWLYLGLSLLLFIHVAGMFANVARKAAATGIACRHLVFLVPGGVAVASRYYHEHLGGAVHDRDQPGPSSDNIASPQYRGWKR